MAVVLLIGAFILSGCLDQGASGDSTEDIPVHDVTVDTSYDPQQTPEEDRGQGPEEGARAVGGRLYIHLVERSTYDEYKQQLDSGLYDPPLPREAQEGDQLSLPSNRTSERYRMPIGSDGIGQFEVLVDRPLKTLVDLEGSHPSPPSDCDWDYWTDDPFEADVVPNTTGTIPYGITC